MNHESISKNNKKRLIYSAFPFIAFVFIMLVVYLADSQLGMDTIKWGLYPRKIVGLRGLLFSPIIHGSWSHLFNNSFPIIILGTALSYYYGRLGVKVFIIMYFLTGFLVWLSARDSYHIGASGLVYSLAGFLFLSGLLRKEKKLMALSLLVTFLYGSLFWGIFPVKDHISWESHLWGGIVGFVLAWHYRHEGPQRIKYDWENEDEEEENPLFEWDHLKQKSEEKGQSTTNRQDNSLGRQSNTPKQRIVIKYEYKKGDNKKPD